MIRIPSTPLLTFGLKQVGQWKFVVRWLCSGRRVCGLCGILTMELVSSGGRTARDGRTGRELREQAACMRRRVYISDAMTNVTPGTVYHHTTSACASLWHRPVVVVVVLVLPFVVVVVCGALMQFFDAVSENSGADVCVSRDGDVARCCLMRLLMLIVAC